MIAMANKFLQLIFPVPLLMGDAENPQISELIIKLAYEYRNIAKDARLVSGKWSTAEKSSDQSDYIKYGVTSFSSGGGLLHAPQWQPIANFILASAKSMISTVAEPGKVDSLRIDDLWTTIYPPGAYVPEHIHSNTLLSGAYYAKAPQKCGNIVFRDPAWGQKTMHFGPSQGFPVVDTKAFFEPKVGRMIIFPAWLPHYTMPNESNDDRIMVSFNLVV